MDVKQIDVSLIKAYAKNAKKHPEEQVKAIANSIREFGFRQPLVLDKNMEIIVGHGRLAAAKLLGMTAVPVVMADDLTEEQVKAFQLADNKTNESEWDANILGGELGDILNIDMSDFGFDLDSISPDEFGDDFELPDGDKPEICQMTFTLHQEQKQLIEYAMSLVENDVFETFGNTNKNGNALYEVVRQWAEQRK